MSSKAPKVLREKVLVQWLKGISRDEIANNVEIGAGSVSNIIKIYRENDSDFDLMREFVVNLKKHGLSIDQLASRLINRIINLHLIPELLDSLLVKIEEHCFKRGTKAEDFIKKVDEVCILSSKTKVPIDELPSEIKKMKRESLLLHMEITMKKLELQRYNISETELEEFRKNRPLLWTLQAVKADLANITKENNAALGKLNQVNDRLDDFILIPKTRKMTLKIAMKIVESQLKEFQIGDNNNLRTRP